MPQGLFMAYVLSKRLLAVAILIFLPVAAHAQDAATRLKSYSDSYARSNDFQGSVLVAREGKILLRESYGWANREHDVRNTPDTKFRIGSVTKQFTATGILLLEQDGKLSTSVSVCKYLPNCPESWQPITLHHLLTHSSGIPDLVRLQEFPAMVTLPTTLDATIDHFRQLPVEFAAGTKVEYGNSGYLVASRIIEMVSGQSYEQFLQQRIFAVAGMKDTGYDRPATVLKARASGYVKQDRVVENAPYIDMTIPSGAGALYSTVNDLLRYMTALTSGKILSPKQLDRAMSNHNPDFGYGWEVGTRNGQRMISHIGDINGFGSFLSYFPQQGVVVVVLTNMERTPAKDINLALADSAFAK
jgi:CubicO group peptidase (beta-lactamase class C family)